METHPYISNVCADVYKRMANRSIRLPINGYLRFNTEQEGDGDFVFDYAFHPLRAALEIRAIQFPESLQGQKFLPSLLTHLKTLCKEHLSINIITFEQVYSERLQVILKKHSDQWKTSDTDGYCFSCEF